MRRKILMYIILFLFVAFQKSFANPADSTYLHHEMRIGWGDMMFETVAFSPSASNQWVNPATLSADYRFTARENVAYTGHIFAEYLYKPLWWLGVGMQADFEGIFWQETTYDRYRNPLSDTQQVCNYNLCFMPTVRFTYFRSEWVQLYSGIGFGLLVALDNSHQTAFNHCMHLNIFSLQVGRGHWAGAVELGSLNSIRNTSTIYMLGSRLLSASISYKL